MPAEDQWTSNERLWKAQLAERLSVESFILVSQATYCMQQLIKIDEPINEFISANSACQEPNFENTIEPPTLLRPTLPGELEVRVLTVLTVTVPSGDFAHGLLAV